MGSTCVVGLQWGDEAKGKIVDLLCDQHDVVVRYQGGANAGHTVVADGVTYKLSLVPTGILRPGIDCVIGNGVVIHPPALLKEIETLIGAGGRRRRPASHQRPGPCHPAVSPGRGAADRGVGSTPPTTSGPRGGGIGPCYRDKVGRVHGVRVADLYHPERVPRAAGPDHRLQEPAAHGDAPRFRAARRRCRGRRIPRLRRAAPAVRPRHDGLAARGRRSGPPLAVRRGPGLAARRRSRQLSLRDQLEQQRGGDRGRLGRADPAHRPLDRRRQGVHDPGRRRAVPDRAGQRDRRADPPRGQGIRHGDRPTAALRLVRRRRRPPRRPRQRLDRDRRHAAGRPQRHRRAESRGRLRDATAAGSPSCPAALPDFERCRPVYETLPGWTEPITEVRRAGPTSPAGAATTSGSSASRSACPCRSSRSAPTGARRSSCPDRPLEPKLDLLFL